MSVVVRSSDLFDELEQGRAVAPLGVGPHARRSNRRPRPGHRLRRSPRPGRRLRRSGAAARHAPGADRRARSSRSRWPMTAQRRSTGGRRRPRARPSAHGAASGLASIASTDFDALKKAHRRAGHRVRDRGAAGRGDEQRAGDHARSARDRVAIDGRLGRRRQPIEGLTLAVVAQICGRRHRAAASWRPTLRRRARSGPGTIGPVLRITEADTLVRVQDGETVVLSGFLQDAAKGRDRGSPSATPDDAVRTRHPADADRCPRRQDAVADRHEERRVPMHEEYYGFSEKPFSLTPDPKYLYKSESHANAFDLLQYAIRRREGFVVVTGDIGTGKTTLCRAILEQLDRKTFTALVLNPFLSEEDLLRLILQDFGVVSREEMKRGTARRGQQAGADRHAQRLPAVAAAAARGRAAHHRRGAEPAAAGARADPDSLEPGDRQGEAAADRAGRAAEPEGSAALARAPSARSAHLDSLRAEAADARGDRRVRRASADDRGGGAAVSFAPKALDLVHRYTGGIPRLINLVCDRALLGGYSARTNRITPEMVASAATGLDLTPSRRSIARWLRRARRAVCRGRGDDGGAIDCGCLHRHDVPSRDVMAAKPDPTPVVPTQPQPVSSAKHPSRPASKGHECVRSTPSPG